MSALLFDSLEFHKGFTFHPSLGSNAIDLVCLLGFLLTEILAIPGGPDLPLLSYL